LKLLLFSVLALLALEFGDMATEATRWPAPHDGRAGHA
jgi:hypothetical protein